MTQSFKVALVGFEPMRRHQSDPTLAFLSARPPPPLLNQWKVANVTPILKKGDKSATSNYRPISLTSVVGKMLESIIARGIWGHLKKHNLIHDSQHGFMKGKSCLTNLLSFYTRVIEAADRDENYDVLYLDFSKAFDKVPHH